jgi:hypothetical protein
MAWVAWSAGSIPGNMIPAAPRSRAIVAQDRGLELLKAGVRSWSRARIQMLRRVSQRALRGQLAIRLKYRLCYDDSSMSSSFTASAAWLAWLAGGAASLPGPERVLPVSGLIPAAIKENDEANHGRWVLNRH